MQGEQALVKEDHDVNTLQEKNNEYQSAYKEGIHVFSPIAYSAYLNSLP